MFTNLSIGKPLILMFSVCLVLSCGKSEDKNESINPKLDKLKLISGFKAEHIYSPGENDQGSWVGMTFDDKGRMIATDQYGAIYRLEIPAIGSEDLTPMVEKLTIGSEGEGKIGMGYAQGVLYAFNSLYVMVNHNPNDVFDKGTGLYRIQDTTGDDQYDKITLIIHSLWSVLKNRDFIRKHPAQVKVRTHLHQCDILFIINQNLRPLFI